MKKRLGKKLDPIEVEEYYYHKFEEEHTNLMRDNQYPGVPSRGQLHTIINKYHLFKKGCLVTFYDCQGNRHNKLAWTGPYTECGSVDVFGIWKASVKEPRAKPWVTRIMDQYHFPLHDCPKGMEYDINLFYQAKYGMFTCHDALQRFGMIRYAEDLIGYWQRSVKDQTHTWHMAIGFHMSQTRFDWNTIKTFRKTYRESKSYQAYLRSHSNHELNLLEIMNRVIAPDFYYQQDLQLINKRQREQEENTLRKVAFYKNQGDNSTYTIPSDIAYLINFEDQAMLEAEVKAIVEKQFKAEMKQIEDRNKKVRTKTIPEFLKAVTSQANL